MFDFSCCSIDIFVLFQYAEGVILNMEGMWEESDVRTPMICLLSMGSDPTSSIEALAKRKNLSMLFVATLLMPGGFEIEDDFTSI